MWNRKMMRNLVALILVGGLGLLSFFLSQLGLDASFDAINSKLGSKWEARMGDLLPYPVAVFLAAVSAYGLIQIGRRDITQSVAISISALAAKSVPFVDAYGNDSEADAASILLVQGRNLAFGMKGSDLREEIILYFHCGFEKDDIWKEVVAAWQLVGVTDESYHDPAPGSPSEC